MGDRHAERVAPTMDELADRFETEHLPKRRPSTQRDYRGILEMHIRPAFGTLRVADVRHADAERLHRKLAVTSPIRANRTVAVLFKMFALAISGNGAQTIRPAV